MDKLEGRNENWWLVHSLDNSLEVNRESPDTDEK